MADTPRADLLVLFGATGDLARRMLLPSLYFLDASGFLDAGFRILASARSDYGREDFLEFVQQDLESRPEGLDKEVWSRFSARLDYLPADATTTDGLKKLLPHLEGAR